MDFGVAGIDDKPLVVGCIDKPIQQTFPDAFVAPSAKAPVGVFPIAVVGRQIAPRGSRAQNPQDSVDEEAIVIGDASPYSFPARQVHFKEFPGFIGDVVASMNGYFVILLHGLRLFYAFSPCLSIS